MNPTYLPFDLMTPWICETLVEKYEDVGVQRPEWMNSENNGKFIKRVAAVYIWKGMDGEKVDKALTTLCRRSVADLEEDVDGQLSFIPSKKNRGQFNTQRAKPEEVKVESV
ncbi:hypothetical protein TrLO_g6166 [Triparma laevis f. longispina]|uniref:Uncharacterized protein n=1 Tax=Triparma laevis f. longispina TaxID=1714387 RepID=A0A9W7FA40_9STRA|nr:hypothetical protein TrLO_g6166 [Triparma laevis f. longispina]